MPGGPGFEPFLTIWFSPRATVRRMAEVNPRHLAWAIVTLITFFALLDTLATMVPLDPPRPLATFLPFGPSGAVLLAAALAPIGIPSLPPLGMLFRWVSGWFRGAATRPEVIAALVWSTVPLLAAWTIVWLAQAWLFGGAVFTEAAAGIRERHFGLLIALALLQLTGSIWSGVAMVLGLAEVNRFPVLNAIAVVVAGSAILAAPALVILVIAVVVLVWVLVMNQ